MGVYRAGSDGAVLAPRGGDGAEAGAPILQVWMCAGRGVMVQYVLPVEGMVQKLVLLFYTSVDVCRTRRDGAIYAPCGGDGGEAGALILQVLMCSRRGVMVQYLLPVERQVQRVEIFF